jgi:murein DD-endopeptidase MepM/ murein hydrolase activator NlpD
VGNDEFRAIDRILSKKEKIIEQGQLRFQNEKFLLIKKTFKNKEEIKPVFSKFNLNKETFDNLISLSSKNLNTKSTKSIKNASNKEIEFQALFLREIDGVGQSSQKNNQLIKIQYTKDENSNLINLKREMVYFSMNNKSYYLFKKNGKNCYFDLNGNSLHSRKMFSIPIEGKYRISSNFGMRFHPVLHYRRMHNGIDLAIRHGHPVKTAAGGVVEFAGRKGGYGNYLLINHGGGYKTGYGHLSRFEKNIRPGKLINKNQLVAYVGTTGTSSGPHLHYEIIKNNKFVDPLSNNPNLPEKLTKDEARIFKKIIENINAELEKQKRLESNKQIIRESNSGNLINQI